MLACSRGNKHLVELLLHLGANLETNKESNQNLLVSLINFQKENFSHAFTKSQHKEDLSHLILKSPKQIDYIYPSWLLEPKDFSFEEDIFFGQNINFHRKFFFHLLISFFFFV